MNHSLHIYLTGRNVWPVDLLSFGWRVYCMSSLSTCCSQTPSVASVTAGQGYVMELVFVCVSVRASLCVDAAPRALGHSGTNGQLTAVTGLWLSDSQEQLD